MPVVWTILGIIATLALLCLVSVLCMPRYLEDMETERL